MKLYRETDEILKLNRSQRLKTQLSEEQKQLIELAWQETRFGARLLYHHLRSRTPRESRTTRSTAISKRQVEQFQTLTSRRSGSDVAMSVDHSGSLLHGDWHRTSVNHPHAIAWLDDASRCIIGTGEFQNATGQNSIETFKAALAKALEHNLIVREVNTDLGTQFYCNKKDGVTKFQRYPESEGIRHIPSGVKKPQTLLQNVKYIKHALCRASWSDSGTNMTGPYCCNNNKRWFIRGASTRSMSLRPGTISGSMEPYGWSSVKHRSRRSGERCRQSLCWDYSLN